MQPQVEGRLAEVMLVEDDASMREALVRILHGAGFCVRAFASAETLFAELKDNPVPQTVLCCICDVHLPGACGFELQRRLAALGATPRWIFITAHDEPALRTQADRARAAYLPKPFHGRALLALVSHAMRPLERPCLAPKGRGG